MTKQQAKNQTRHCAMTGNEMTSLVPVERPKKEPLTKSQIKHYAQILREMSLTETKYEDILTPLANNRLKFEATYRRLQRSILNNF